MATVRQEQESEAVVELVREQEGDDPCLLFINDVQYYAWFESDRVKFDTTSVRPGGGLEHRVNFVRLAGGKPVECSCKDYQYRRRACKHMQAAPAVLEGW